MKNVVTLLIALGALALSGCESKPETSKPAVTAEPGSAKPAAAQPAAPASAAKPASTGGW